ncbi:MAG TPA: 1,4-dihydroxy-2-naphthoate polyprenyltransferase [Candidatus Lustribacter sp.]
MQKWIAGARLPTLPAAIVPVLVGTAAAGMPYHLDRALLAAIVALALQVGVNFANDYSDGIRGTDKNRTGPARLVASGLAAPAAVLRAAIVAFAIAAVAGIALSLQVDPWLILVGFSAIAAAWFYTGGPKPYGYNGLGEVFVFIFFGLVGTLGSTYVQHGSFTLVSALASLAVGSLTTALLVVNNLRDIPGDAATGKRTLAVKIGDEATRRLYLALLAAAALATLAVGALDPWALLAFIAAAAAVRPIQIIRSGATGGALVPVLIDTGRLELAFGILFAASVAAWH